MALTQAIQECLVALLCYDDSVRGGKFVKNLIPPSMYDVYYRDIAQAAINYIQSYDRVPGEHTPDIIDTIKARQNEDVGEIYDKLFRSLQQTSKNVNREYILSRASAFMRRQSFKQAITVGLDLLQDDNEEDDSKLNEAQALLDKASKVSYDLFDPGTFLHDASKALAFLDQEEDCFPTGIKELDQLGLGPARKRLHLFMALYKKGKTWWLSKLIKSAHMVGANTLYVGLEMGEADACQRLIQSLFSVTKRNEVVKVTRFKKDIDGQLTELNPVVIENRPHMRDPGIRAYLTKKLKKLEYRPKILVKQFPTGSLTIPRLEAYLDMLEGIGFIPDLIVIDYPDLMEIDPKNERQFLSKIYKDTRGVGIKRNAAMCIVTQSNREGEGATTIGGKHTSGDFSKLGTVDVAISYSQTDTEHELGLARLQVIAGRTDRDRFTVLISQAYAMGQFCVDSSLMSDSYWELVEGDSSDDQAE